jgi:hypothetical protein
MSDIRVIESDPTGKTALLYTEEDGKSVIIEREDVEALVERNKALQAGPPTVSKTGELELVASIPGAVHFRLKKLGIIRPQHEDPWQRRLMRWIKDHPAFRTSLRRIV